MYTAYVHIKHTRTHTCNTTCMYFAGIRTKTKKGKKQKQKRTWSARSQSDNWNLEMCDDDKMTPIRRRNKYIIVLFFSLFNFCF